MAETWVILYCSKDDSYSLVKDVDVICDTESLSVSDVVNFYYSGQLFKGVVEKIGDDHDKLKSELLKLNASRPKKGGSFHSDKPRKSAVKCNQDMKALTSGKRLKSQEAKEALLVKSNKETAYKKVSSKSSNGQKKRKTASFSEEDNAPLSQIASTSQAVPAKSLKVVERSKEISTKNAGCKADDDSSDSSVEFDNLVKSKMIRAVNSKEDIAMESIISSDSSGEESNSLDELTPAELKLLEKLSARSRVNDYKSLLGYASKKNKLSEQPQTDSLPKLSSTDNFRSIQMKSNCRYRSHAGNSSAVSTIPSVDASESSGFISKKLIPEGAQFGPETDESQAEEQPKAKKQHEAEKQPQAEEQPEAEKQPQAEEQPEAEKQPQAEEQPEAEKQLQAEEQPEAGRPHPLASMLRFTSLRDDLEELLPNSGIYVKILDMKDVRGKTTSVTACARALLRCVFTQDALNTCSVRGMPSHGKGAELASVRPPLYQPALDAVIEFAQKRALKKNWKELTPTAIRSSLSSMLSERRNTKRNKTVVANPA